MLDFVIEAVAEVLGGVLDFILDGISVKIASRRRAMREKRQKVKSKSGRTEK